MRKIDIFSWDDVKGDVEKIDPILANIINDLGVKKTYKLVKATYLYGDLIVNQGTTQIPTKDGILASVFDSDLSEDIKNKLSYQSIPLFLTLKNDNEVFIDTGKRAIPLNLFHQGSLLGAFETIDFLFGRKSNPRWCVSAGARTIFTLPKITDTLGLNKLRLHYNIDRDINLQRLQDHWELFKAIATSENFEQPWQNEVLFFTDDWLGHYNDCKWLKFYQYLYDKCWHQIQGFSLSKIEHAFLWENFAEIFAIKNQKPRPFLADHIKHILSIAMDRSPGFYPVNNQTIAPITKLQQSLIDTYGLKKYLPTIMSINSLQDANINTVYYSLSYPTLLEGSPINNASSTIMLDFRKIKQLFDSLKKHSKKHPLFTNSIIENLDLKFFHVESDQFGEITKSSCIFNEDTSFHLGTKSFPDHRLCDTSLFWRGCVKIKILS